MSKIHLSQVLKFKTDATGKVDLSRFGYVSGGYDISRDLKSQSDITYGTIAGLPSFVPEPCKGCSQWRGSICYDVNGDPCWYVRDWLNKDSSD